MTTKLSLSEWLENCSKPNYPITDVKPCKVFIGKSVYNACQYTTSTETRLYILGSLPASYKHSTHVKYILNNEVWYIGGYYQTSNPVYDRYHYGKNFGLHKWTALEPIDKYERVPYKSMTIRVEYL